MTEAWSAALQLHPDRAFVRYITDGLQVGFRVGFQYGSPLKSAASNMASAHVHREVISEYLHKERALGRMLGPFSTTHPLPPLHINRFGVIPKGHNTGKWRLITDLSFPDGSSVNDGIDAALCSLSYTTIDDVASIATVKGTGALLAKINIESAYRLIPVHPQDRPLQAMRWEGQIYVDPMLPFGLRSAPKIFNAVADALNWILHQSGVPIVCHYLDDFIIVAPPNSQECSNSLEVIEKVCSTLGVPIAAHKREGPTTCLTFLGIEINTITAELRLPQEKLQRIVSLLGEWGDRKACLRRDLESLIGLLNHACKVVRSGRSFLRRMIDLLHSVQRSPHGKNLVRLNRGFRADLAWWRQFVTRWNGISYLPPPSHLPRVEVTTDASGTWGCGGWHEDKWFQLQWDARSQHLSIAEKELIPITLACAMWGSSWHGRQVVCYCDNQVVVACLRSRSSRDKGVMHLLRSLVFIEAHFNCHLKATYINTHANHLADDLSRNNLTSFLRKMPQSNPYPTQVPLLLLDLLLDPEAKLDLSSLAPALHQYFQAGLAPSTNKAYQTATRRFHNFCLKYNVHSAVRTHTLLLSHISGRGGSLPTDGKGLPVGVEEPADIIGSSRPKGACQHA